MMNQLTLKLNFGANTEGRECSLTFFLSQNSQMYTATSETIQFVGKGKKNKPTLVTNLFTHSNNTMLYF